MSSVKQHTIEILNELIPELCPEEQEVFELYSDALFEQAIDEENNNKMGDDSYFGEAAGLITHDIMLVIITLLVKGTLEGSGKYSWKKLHETYLKYKPDSKRKQSGSKPVPLSEKLAEALEKALADRASAESNDE
jgi:hypothetical protein